MAKKNNGSSSVKAAVAGACFTVLSGLCFGIGLEAAKSIYHKAAWTIIKKRYGADDSDDDFFDDEEDDDLDDISDIDVFDLDEITDEEDIEEDNTSGGDADEQP